MRYPILMVIIILIFSSSTHALEPVHTLYTYDMTYIHKLDMNKPGVNRRIWDEMHFTASIQGIANRKSAKLYTFLVGDNDAKIDRYWLDYMRRHGNWLNRYRLQAIPNLDTLVKTFRADIKGLVVYDENVPSTSNVASTVAGVNDLACVRFDKSPNSLFQRLTTDPNGPMIPVKVWLVNKDGTSMFTGKGTIPGTATPSTGSAKCDAYMWAKIKLLDTGKCNPTKMGYYLDAYWLKSSWGYAPQNSLANHDFFISKKAFFFDLSPWDDEAPNDDPNQPAGTDVKTLKAILLSAYNRTGGKSMIHIGGFVPWERKYSSFNNVGGSHDVVPGEWRYAETISCFNAFMDADAFAYNPMANASVFQHYPLKKIYSQKLPTLCDLKSKGYILPDGKVAPRVFASIYMGDYDSAAWLYNNLPRMWEDTARGTIPLGWGFNPNLAERFAPGMVYSRETKSPNDYFVAGDCGAGYLNPGYLVEPRLHSGLPSGLDAWTKHCERWFKQWQLSLTGFIIDGNAPPMNKAVMDAYTKFSPDGLAALKTEHTGLHKEMPFVRMEYLLDIARKPETQAPIVTQLLTQQKPDFLMFRSVLWTPSEVKQLMDMVKAAPESADVEFVDPYTLMLLVKQYHKMNQKPTYTSADIWDVRSGAEVTGHSGVSGASDIRDIFGGSFGKFEKDTVLFEDNIREPYTHWVEWKTVKPVNLEGFKLYATGDGGTNRSGPRNREFKKFQLYAKLDKTDEWTRIYTYTPTHPYTLETESLLSRLLTGTLDKPVKAQYFRAEFDQCDTPDDRSWGPRIIELDGIGSVES